MKKKLDYNRVSDSPYAPGSKEDRDLSMAMENKVRKNRAAAAQGFKDVASGRALVEGAKAVGRFLTQNISRTEKRHQEINGWPAKKPRNFKKPF